MDNINDQVDKRLRNIRKLDNRLRRMNCDSLGRAFATAIGKGMVGKEEMEELSRITKMCSLGLTGMADGMEKGPERNVIMAQGDYLHDLWQSIADQDVGGDGD